MSDPEPKLFRPNYKIHLWLIFLLIIFSGSIACSNANVSSSKDTTFRMTIKSEPPTLDASLATDNVSFDLLTNLMEGLTQYNEHLEAIPAIAKRWEFSNDGKTLTFFLRDDVYWTDGKKLTAHDFEYSWKRLLNPATAAEYAYFLFDIENASEYNSGKLKDPDQVGVRATSESVLEVRLNKPVVYFPSITTFMVTFPLRKDIIETHGDHWTDPGHIVSNGPFELEEWQHEYKIILKSNPRYYGSPPGVDRIEAYVVREDTTALTLYETGDLDMVELPPVAIPHFQNSPEYRNVPLLRGYYYGFNTGKAPFNDARVRRALAHAIDRSKIPTILKGGEIPTASWIPKGMFGYNEKAGAGFDPARARELLKQAGYPEGRGFPTVTAVYNSDPVHRLISEFIQDQWKRHLNIQVEFDSQEWKVFLSGLKLDPPPIFRLGWGADFPDPDNFMNLFTSTSGNNHLRWANTKYDELVAEGAAETDPVKRQTIYDEAQSILTLKESPIISLFITTQNLLVKPYVEGLKLNSMELLYLKHVKLKR